MVVLGNLRIKTISLWGNLLLSGVALACAILAYWSTAQLGSRLEYAADNTIPSLGELGKLNVDTGNARLLMAKHIVNETVAGKLKIEEQLAAKIAEVDAGIVRYRPFLSDAEDETLFGNFVATWGRWKAKSAEIRKDSLAMDLTGSRVRFETELNPIGFAMGEELEKTLDYNVNLGRNSGEEGKLLAGRSSTMAIAAGIFAALCATGVVMLFLHRVIGPLGRITEAMTDMASGNLNREIPCGALRDEVGDIGRALDAIKQATAERARRDAAEGMAIQQQIVGELGNALSALRDGKLNAQIRHAFPGEYETLRKDFNEALTAIASILHEVSASAENVRTGAGEIASAAADLSNRTESQAAALEESAAAVRQVSHAVSATAKTASEATHTARAAEKDATDSGSVMVSAVSAMEEIARSSSRMQAIVALIEGIAFQTNLLALNAGVEAARAGDAGKGFAVVATEVRALAQRSSDAAKEIAVIIQTSGRDVNNGVQMIGQTQSALTQIVERTRELSGMIEGIATSAHEQSLAIRQVENVVSEMDRITQQNAALVEESTAASRSLAGEATNLGTLVDRFELDQAGSRQAFARAA